MIKLNELDVFKYLSPDEIAYVEQYLKLSTFMQDEPVICQAHHNENLYIIDSGTFSVSITLPGDYRKEIVQLTRGSFFGETSMLSGDLSTAWVTAITPATAIILTRDVLHSIRILSPDLALKIEKSIAEISFQRINRNLENIHNLLGEIYNKIKGTATFTFQSFPASPGEMKNFPLSKINMQKLQESVFFKRYDKTKLDVLLHAFKIVSVPRGYQFALNEESCFGFVFQGAMQYCINYKDQLLTTLDVIGPGGIFGQHTYFGGHNPLIKLFVREDMILFLLDKSSFAQLKFTDITIWQQVFHYLCQKTVSMLYVVDRQHTRIASQYGDLLS